MVNDVLTQYQRHVTQTVHLDLNGKSVTAEEGRRVLVADGGSLSICDSVGTGRVYSTGTSGQGLVAWVKGNSQLNLYSGIFDGSVVSTTAYGATVAMENGGTFNMYGGTVKGGTTTGDGSAVGGYGGTTFNLYGGTIYGGTANVGGAVLTSGSFTMEGGTIHGGTATYGGSLYLGGDNTYTISGGTITGGTATDKGGNIFTAADYVKLDISGDAVISYGKSESHGGNICAYGPVTVGGSAQLLNDEAHKINGGGANIYGGHIVTVKDNAIVSGGYAVKAGGNILMNYGCYLFIQDNAQILDGYTDDSGGNIRGHIEMSGGKVLGGIAKANGKTYNMHIHDRDLNMSGGLIDGGVWVSSTTTVTLSGNAKIKDGWSNLWLNDGIKVTIEEGFAGEIWIDLPGNSTGIFSGAGMSGYAEFFHSTDGFTVTATENGELQLT